MKYISVSYSTHLPLEITGLIMWIYFAGGGGIKPLKIFEHRRDIKAVFLENEFSDVIQNGLNTRVWK